MRSKAFGEEPADTLLDSMAVAWSALDCVLSGETGHIDLRKTDPDFWTQE